MAKNKNNYLYYLFWVHFVTKNSNFYSQYQAMHFFIPMSCFMTKIFSYFIRGFVLFKNLNSGQIKYQIALQ